MTTVITKPTFSLDGWTSNTIDNQGTDWFCNLYDGWFGPVGTRTSSVDRPTQNGAYSSASMLTPRVVTLGGIAKTVTEQAFYVALDQFNALLADGQLHEMVVEEPFRTLRAMVRRGSNPQAMPYSTTGFDWQVVVVAPDPRKYSTTVQTSNTGLATAAPGGVLWGGPAGVTGVPWGGPAGTTGVVWQSGVSSTGTMILANGGNESAPIEFVITDPSEAVVNPTITEFGTGNVLSYGGTVPQGSSLVINTATGSVLLDGANRAPLMTRVEWMTIPAWGSTQVVFSATGSAPSANLLARWSDTYI